MSDFDALVAEYTRKGSAKVHGVVFKCVDSKGNEIFSKVAGYDSLAADASPLREDAVFKVASVTKLITSIALLQCVEKGLVGLDQPLTKILPELDGKEILQATPEGQLTLMPSKRPITARHLLTHTSGLGYPFTNPLLAQWRETPEGLAQIDSEVVAERYNAPLLFEPGEGWLYGTSLDWAGVVVRRLNGGQSLEDYMVEHIWKPLGLAGPFPTFHISAHPEYRARLMGAAERAPDGGLRPFDVPLGDNPVDQDGGSGLSLTARDLTAVLGDLIAASPRLLRPETVALLFTPQLGEGSAARAMLVQLRLGWEYVAGPAADGDINHGLGGALVRGPVPALGQPAGLLAWGGATNPVWFASRELGVAGFFGTQIWPFGDPACRALVEAWKKAFFEGLGAAAAAGAAS